MKWIYRMFLEYNGRVTEYRVNFGMDSGMQESYDIIGHDKDNETITLQVTFYRSTGFMEGRVEKGRSYVSVYEIGSSKPVEYVGKIDWTTFGEEELNGLKYQKIEGATNADDETQ